MLKGFYPGSFDPLTFGHLDIMKHHPPRVHRPLLLW